MNDKLTSLEKTKHLFYKNYDDPDYAKNYAEQLQVCLNDGIITVEDAREEFEHIQSKYPRLYHIRNFFTEALAPWIFDDVEIIKTTLKEVEDYYRRNPNNESLAESFALSLWLLYEHPKSTARDSVLESFSELINAFPDNEIIADKYYQALELYDVFHFSEKTDNEASLLTEPKEILSEQDAIKYADFLFEYSKSQDEKEEINKVFSNFESLCKQFPAAESIKELYVKTVYYAIPMFEDNERIDLIGLANVIQNNSASESVAMLYALLLEDAPFISWAIVEELQRLYEQFPSNDSIIDSYGFVLSAIIKGQRTPEEQRDIALSLFSDLLNNRPENEILLDYIQ